MTKQYYELTDDKSAKFWEVEQKGTVVRLRWGKIGANGQTKIKELGSSADAKKEVEKLVKQKTNKGYEPASDSTAKKSVTHKNYNERQAYLKLLMDMSKWGKGSVTKGWESKNVSHLIMTETFEAKFLDKNADFNCKKSVVVDHESIDDEFSSPEEEWISPVRLLDDLVDCGCIYDVKRLAICHWDEYGIDSIDNEEACAQDVVDWIVKNKESLTHIEALQVGNYESFYNAEFEFHFDHMKNADYERFWKAMPNLKSISIVGNIKKLGVINNNKLHALKIEGIGNYVKEIFSDLSSSVAPHLERVDVPYLNAFSSDINDSSIVKSLFEGDGVGGIEYFGMKYSEYADSLLKGLSEVTNFRSLKEVDVSYGALTDNGAEAILSMDECALTIIADNHFLSKDMVKSLQNKFPHFQIGNNCKWNRQAIKRGVDFSNLGLDWDEVWQEIMYESEYPYPN